MKNNWKKNLINKKKKKKQIIYKKFRLLKLIKITITIIYRYILIYIIYYKNIYKIL